MIHPTINIGREVNKFINKINRHVGKSVSEYGITGPQAHMLNFIYDRSKISYVLQRDIEKEFDIRRSTTTVALQILEKQGLITREVSENDARSKIVILTKKGLKIQQLVSQIIMDSEIALRESLTDAEFNVMISVIIKLSSIYEKNLSKKWNDQ